MIEEIGDRILSYCLSESFINKLKLYFVEPLIQYLLERLYPYILMVSVIFMLMFVCVVLTLSLLLRG